MIKSYSDATLMSLTKAELIEHLRCAEHNRAAIEQRLEQHIENVKDWQPIIHGHWIGRPLCGNENCRCSNCGCYTLVHANLKGEIMQKYCSNCGALMIEVN